MRKPRDSQDAAGNFLLVLIVSLVLGFVLWQKLMYTESMDTCLARYSEATCNHILGR